MLDDDQEFSLVRHLQKFPYCRLIFVTIRDPSQKCNIGKAYDWIKKRSDVFYIVMSPHGGTHFHLIAGLKSGSNTIPLKRYHFNVQTLGDPKSDATSFEFPSLEERKEAFIKERVKSIDRQTIVLRLRIPHECLAISRAVLKHFSTRLNRRKRIEKETKKTQHINRVLTYMNRNLYEDRSDDYYPDKYVDYILKCPVTNNTIPGTPIPLGDGIEKLTTGPI